MERMNLVTVEHRCPAGVSPRVPSAKLTEALEQFGRSDELKVICHKAEQNGKRVIVEVYHGADGTPILIHIATRKA